MQITPTLWFDGQAEAAASFYTSIFEGEIISVNRYTESGPGETDTVLTVEFDLFGRRYIGLNGGPMYSFTEAISFQIGTKDQAELDHFWDALLANGGTPSQCGWLKDQFGLS